MKLKNNIVSGLLLLALAGCSLDYQNTSAINPDNVWNDNYFGDIKIVDVNIRRLRMKIEDEPSIPQHIVTVWGLGYKWEE